MPGAVPSSQFSAALSPQEASTLRRAARILERRFIATPNFAVRCCKDVVDYLRFRFAGLDREEFHALWLDVRHQLIAAECLSVGTLTRTVVYPREIIKRALKHNAAAVIFAHNHPSGNAKPSATDHALTEELKIALHLIDVRLCDHIVVTEREVVGIERLVSRRRAM